MNVSSIRKIITFGVMIYIITMSITPIMGGSSVDCIYQYPIQKYIFSKTYGENLRTIIVPDDYPTIQQAINHAIDGDTILVRAGTYAENIVVNKMVYIRGDGHDLTIIDGSGKDTTVKIERDGVEISGFCIRNAGSGNGGVYATSHYNNISMNEIIDNGYGIKLEASNGNRILDNWINNNQGRGIWLDSSHMNEISGNNVSLNEEDGLMVDFTSTFNSLSSNIASENKLNGVLINDASRSNTLIGNKLTKNSIGVSCQGTSDNNIFHHNDFKENIQQNAFDSSNDIWSSDTLGKGNHWSDFDETEEGAYDMDNNGIIDTPYLIPGGDNSDPAPLLCSVAPAPPLIKGPSEIRIDTEAEFHIYTPTPVYDEVYYQIYWGNGAYWETTDNLVDVTVGIDESHVWSMEVTFNVQARAFIEIEGVRIYSEASPTLPVKVPKESKPICIQTNTIHHRLKEILNDNEIFTKRAKCNDNPNQISFHKSVILRSISLNVVQSIIIMTKRSNYRGMPCETLQSILTMMGSQEKKYMPYNENHATSNNIFFNDGNL